MLTRTPAEPPVRHADRPLLPRRHCSLALTVRPTDTTTSSSCSSSVTLVLESPACCSALPTTHTQRATSQRSASISCVALLPPAWNLRRANMWQKIRTIELDGKTVKLQIVRTARRQQMRQTADRDAVGHRRPRALPNHHILVLPRRSRHLRRLRCHRHGLVQQREAMAAGD
jgi:hypothetical protein